MNCRRENLLWIVPWVALVASVAPAQQLRADEAADREFTFAVRLVERGEHKLAEEAFGQFIAKFTTDPRVGDAHYYLAVLARRRGDLGVAEQHLAHVQNPKHVTDAALRLLRGQVQLEQGRGKEALAQLEGVKPEALPDDASRATWNYLLGSAYRTAGNAPAAAERFAAAAKADSPVRPAALVELGKVYSGLDKPAQAIQAFTQALAANPSPAVAAEARSLAADLAYGHKQYDQAADLYRQVVEHHQSSPAFGPAVVGVMRSLFAGGHYDQVVRQYETTRTLVPQELLPETLYLVGASQVQLQQYAKASEQFLEFLRLTRGEHPLAGEVAYHYALCFYHTDLDAFEKWVASFEKDLPKMSRGSELQYLRAQAAIRRNKPQDAIRYLTPLIQAQDNPYAKDALSQRATLYEQIGQPSAAADDYAEYARRFGNDPTALDAGRRAIDLAFRSSQFERVVDLSGQWLARKDVPADQAAEVRLKQSLALMKLNRADEALRALDSLQKSNPTPPLAAQGAYWRGVILAARSPGDSAAIESLRKAAGGALPEEQKAAALMLVARQQVLAGREKEALETYEQLRALRSPEKIDPALAVWIGRGLAQAGREEAALQWLRPVTARDKLDPTVRAEALFHAAQSLRRLGRHDQAVETYRQLVALGRGYEEQGRLGLARSLQALGKSDLAISEYDGLISAHASQVAAEALLQSSLLRLSAPDATRQRQEVRKRLNRIVILYDVPQLAATVGRALLALGEMELADGDKESARRNFQNLLARQAQNPWHDLAQADLMILEGNLGGAAAALRKIDQQSGDAAAKAHAQRRLKDIGDRP